MCGTTLGNHSGIEDPRRSHQNLLAKTLLLWLGMRQSFIEKKYKRPPKTFNG